MLSKSCPEVLCSQVVAGLYTPERVARRLRRTRDRRDPLRWSGMPAAASIAVILNAASGTALGRLAMEAEIVDLFRAAGRDDVEIVTLQNGQDPAGAAQDASARASIVVAAGGDGTVSSVAAGSSQSQAALGILPLGTLNHFAKDLRIPLDLAEAVAHRRAPVASARRRRAGQRPRLRQQLLDRHLSRRSSTRARSCVARVTASGRRWRSRPRACCGATAA